MNNCCLKHFFTVFVNFFKCNLQRCSSLCFNYQLFEVFFFFFAYLPSPNLGLNKPNARGSDACRGSNSLWIRSLDRYTRAGLPECTVFTMAGPPPKTTQDRTQRTHTQSQDRNYNSWSRRESNPGRRVGRQGLYRPRHGDDLKYFYLDLHINFISSFTWKQKENNESLR